MTLTFQDDMIAEINDRSPVWARNPILAGYRGSHAHGTFIEPTDPMGTDDIDVFGVAVRDPNYYLGLDGYLSPEKETFTTAGETLDIETHEVRKFCYLLMKSNPNVHQHLWLQPEHYFVISRAGQILLDNRRAFMSRALFESYAGYADDQLCRMEKFEKRGYMGTKREGIVKEFGYDVKNAAHCIRLFYGAIHLARHGSIQVWLSLGEGAVVREIKRGEWSLDSVKRLAKKLFEIFDAAKELSTLPERIDRSDIGAIARRVIEAEWEERSQSTERHT